MSSALFGATYRTIFFFLNHIEIGDTHLNHSVTINQSLEKCTSIVCQHIMNSCKNTIENPDLFHWAIKYSKESS